MEIHLDVLTFGELFAGAGGMAYGLREAGFTPTWAVDRDRDACATYSRMIGAHGICDSVENIRFREIDPVSGLAFGFPCNDFSMVGERKGTDGYFGGLYKFAEKALNEIEPDWFIAENVPGLMANGGHDIMQEFANAGPGYNLSIHLFRFEEYGVPQRRWRVIGVGIRSDREQTFRPPAPTHLHPVSAREALAGVESVASHNERTKHTSKVIDLLNSIPPGENCWSPEVPLDLRLNVKNVKMSLIYRRLHPDEPSYTVVAAGGGGTHGYHFEEPRALTNRERARIQSFPDTFVFEGDPASVRKQIGMAVPPLGAKRIGEALLKTLHNESYPAVEASVGVIKGKTLLRAPDRVDREQLTLFENRRSVAC